MRRRKLAFWLLFLATGVVYVLVAGWSFDIVEMEAGGAKPFDLMTPGYTFDEAESFLARLSPEGYAHYQSIQQPLDILFIGLYAATFFFAIQALIPATWSSLAYRVLPLAAMVPAVFDLLENRAVSALLSAGAGHVTPEAVATASRWTELKSFAGIALLIFVLVLLTIRAVTVFRARAGARRA